MDEGLADQGALGGLDRLFEPALERQVVAQAAQQRHRGMAVGVDQPGNEQVLGPGVDRQRRQTRPQRGQRGDRADAAVLDEDAMVVEDVLAASDRGNPAWGEDKSIHGREKPFEIS